MDLPAQSERHLHAWLESADVPALTAELEVGLGLRHVMDDGKDSLQLLERLLGRCGSQLGYVVVLNRGRGGDIELFERSPLGEQLEELHAPDTATARPARPHHAQDRPLGQKPLGRDSQSRQI